MTQDGKIWGWQFGFVRAWAIGGAITLTGGLALSGNRALAQIIPDATLGAERSIVTPNANVKTLPADLIEGGALRGTNLFHSFQEFNVGNGQRVYFANPAGIENILSRVTGNNLSKIFGTLGVNGGANLFLLNPNGIIFGPNARLDISGSFVGSTANSLVWGNGLEFSANNPQAPPLLTIKLRPGLQYGTNQPGATIANAGTLAVGKDLTLAAGNLDLQGQLSAGGNLTLQAQDTVRVRDSVTNPFVAAAGGQLLVQGDRTVDIFALNHPASGFFSGGDMVLKSPNSVIGDAHYTTGGNFRIEQSNGVLGNLSSPTDPVIRAIGNVSFDSYEGGSLHIFAGGSVNIGSVTINGRDATNFINETVTLSDGTSTVTVNGSDRPTLDIRAGTTAVGTPLGVTGNPTPNGLTFPNTALTADITIDNINIIQPNGLVFLTNQYQPNPALAGNIQVRSIRVDDNGGSLFGRFSGNSGDVIIDSRGNITIPPNGFINTFSSTGKAGNITLIANDSFSMTDGARLDASTGGQENAGDINIKVGNAVSLTGGNTWIQSFVQPGAIANSGTINIQAGSLSLTKGGAIFSTIRGQGNGGDINVNVRDAVTIDGVGGNSNSGIYTVTYFEGVGNSGNINLEAGELFLTNGGNISSFIGKEVFGTRVGQGTAGDININVRNTATINGARREPVALGDFSITVDNSSILSLSPGGNGAGGNISLRAGALSITDGGYIDSSTRGLGDAGNIDIVVRDSLTLAGVSSATGGASGLYATTNATGQAGQITVSAGTFRVADGDAINAGTYGQGNAGNINIAVRDAFTLAGVNSDTGLSSGLFVNAGRDASGQAGNITVSAATFRIADGAVVDATTTNVGNGIDTGARGNIEINTRNLSLQNGGKIDTSTFNQSSAGSIAINSLESVTVGNGSGISALSYGSGTGGNLSINTETLTIRDGGFVVTSTASRGNAGNLTVRATNSVNVIDNGLITTGTVGTGAGGELLIETRNLNIQNSGKVFSSSLDGRTFDFSSLDPNIYPPAIVEQIRNIINTASQGNFTQGNSGNLTVSATDSVNVSDSGALSTLGEGRASGGNLLIQTQKLSVLSQGEIATDISGSGNAGSLTINATDSVEVANSGSDITTQALPESTGNGGRLAIATGQLVIRDGAAVSSATFGQGLGGDVQLQANSLSLTNSGRITSRSEGSSNAGNIAINLSDTLQSSTGEIVATATQAGGGNVDITASDIRLRNSSLVSSSVFDSTGGGGNININSTVFIALEDSDILANAVDGRGGNITIKSPAFLADLFSSGKAVAVGRNPGDFSPFRGNGRVDISAEATGSGSSGTVNLPNVDLTRGLTQLPTDLVDAERLIDRRCTPSGAAKRSSFTVTGRGGLPPSPNEPLRGEAVIADWITLDAEPEKRDRPNPTPHPTSTTPEQLVEAQGWVIGPNGQVILTAQAPTVTPQNPGLTVPPCQGSHIH